VVLRTRRPADPPARRLQRHRPLRPPRPALSGHAWVTVPNRSPGSAGA